MAEKNPEAASESASTKVPPIYIPPPTPPPTPKLEAKIVVQIALALVSLIGIFYLVNAIADLREQLFGFNYRQNQKN